MIVAIDGPAGAGKSTIAKKLAERLGFRHLDTGATYRAVALAVFRSGVKWEDTAEVRRIANAAQITFRDDKVFLNNEDVTPAIRMREVTEVIHYVADDPEIRSKLVELQRAIAGANAIVTEGRDQGTVAFPNAACKIYLTASPEERARRRFTERNDRGDNVEMKTVLQDMQERDHRDRTRPVGALRKAEDAVEVHTDGKTVDEVLNELEAIVREKGEGKDDTKQ